ncbi:hypothetical protein NFI95_07570 [Acetobacteraceae bacterium KSS8]|uniref:Uncharacterized protein n=1 Tax=Endosaccharibacter trunci TaxID=2812733 RepID=A0ABT1W618_9PROT|nr:hypothetical protein [Acetobacteraceae bacterium KSS8]
MDMSIGAVGAAVVAGIVSIFGIIISKEQKVSEFRQAWIDELRKCLIIYLVNINAICDAVRQIKAGGHSHADLASSYKLLNEASHGIKLRINQTEKPAKMLLRSMEKFEILAEKNENITPENIRPLELEFLKHSRRLLKFEWKRVKKGESTFIWARRVVIAVTALLIAFLIYLGIYK